MWHYQLKINLLINISFHWISLLHEKVILWLNLGISPITCGESFSVSWKVCSARSQKITKNVKSIFNRGSNSQLLYTFIEIFTFHRFRHIMGTGNHSTLAKEMHFWSWRQHRQGEFFCHVCVEWNRCICSTFCKRYIGRSWEHTVTYIVKKSNDGEM